jgi:transmembrane sensor
LDIDQIKALLKKYSTGVCSIEEKKIIEQWLAETENSNAIAYNDDFIVEQLAINKSKINSRLNSAV